MWLFLWLVFVLAMAGFFVWSYHATYEQKRAWKTYAAKFNLNYVPNKLMQPPTMSGDIKGRLVNFYPQIVENAQGQRSTQTVVEVFLNNVPDTLCVVASHGFGDFVQVLDLPEPFDVNHPKWPKNALARTFDNENPVAWFLNNEDRVNAISDLSKLPFAVAFLCDGDQAFLAIRTPNTLGNPKRINQVVGKLFDIATKLESADVVVETPQEEQEKTDTDE